MIRAILDRLRGVQSAMPTRASNHTGSILRRADGQYRGRVQLGTPLQANNLTRYFRRAARECGIPSDFRFHDLRHTHATLLLRARGVSVADVSKNLGHYSPAVTHGIYNHAEDSNGDAYRAAVEGLIHAGQ